MTSLVIINKLTRSDKDEFIVQAVAVAVHIVHSILIIMIIILLIFPLPLILLVQTVPVAVLAVLLQELLIYLVLTSFLFVYASIINHS